MKNKNYTDLMDVNPGELYVFCNNFSTCLYDVKLLENKNTYSVIGFITKGSMFMVACKVLHIYCKDSFTAVKIIYKDKVGIILLGAGEPIIKI